MPRAVSTRPAQADTIASNRDRRCEQGPDHEGDMTETGTGRRTGAYRAHRQDKPWGHELIFATGEDGYVAKIIHVRAGESLSLQYHRVKVETIAVTAGIARVEYGPAPESLTTTDLHAGDVIHLPAGALHRIAAIENVTFVEASTAEPGWRDDVVRLEDRYGRTGTSTP